MDGYHISCLGFFCLETRVGRQGGCPHGAVIYGPSGCGASGLPIIWGWRILFSLAFFWEVVNGCLASGRSVPTRRSVIDRSSGVVIWCPPSTLRVQSEGSAAVEDAVWNDISYLWNVLP